MANLFNANDGVTGRDGGPYLDVEQARDAEVLRARVEDRKPDLDNPPANAGIRLLTAKQVFANVGINNLPSQDGKGFVDAEVAMEAIAKADNPLKIADTVPDEALETPEDEEEDKPSKDDEVLGSDSNKTHKTNATSSSKPLSSASK